VKYGILNYSEGQNVTIVYVISYIMSHLGS